MPDYPSPFVNYYFDKNAPGASSDAVSGQYYTRKTLGDAGWNQQSIDAVQQIPVRYGPMGMGASSGGTYGITKGNGSPWTYMGVDTDYGGGNDRALSQALEHEMMHAWAGSANSDSNAIPPAIRTQDYKQVLGQLPSLNMPADSYSTWRSQPGAPANQQVDDNHYPQTLFNMGYNPGQIPQWYKDKYLSEYNQ